MKVNAENKSGSDWSYLETLFFRQVRITADHPGRLLIFLDLRLK